jgi:alkanesulfonate monooxygenase SsuD/methylene tetrahydromethanopterin reductase-like flavin-dependent oxidoreductase (luciferase family)
MSDGPGGVITWAHARDFAQHAEAMGLDSLWVCDHLLSELPDGPVEGILESWTVLSALAVVTSQVELGQLVMCTAFRQPGLLAKMAVTADAVSGGRITLGVGAGWTGQEYEAFGYPTDHRVDRFEESLRIIVPLLRGETATVAGRFHGTRDAVLLPPPQRQIPILVAASGDRMIRLTAHYAQAWNTAWHGPPDGALNERLDAMSAALAAENRDPTSLRRTVGLLAEDPQPDELARALDAYEYLGIDDVIVGLVPRDLRSLDRLAVALRLRGKQI